MSPRPNLPGADALFGSTAKASSIDAPDAPQKTASVEADGEERGPADTPPRELLPASSPPNNAEREQLRKYTLYFSPSLLEKLDDTWFRLRRMRQDKVTKWRIVHALLEAHLDDIGHITELLDRKHEPT